MDGTGDTHGLLRRNRRVREVARELAEVAGRGMSVYTRYDTLVADATVRWLRERGNAGTPGRRDDGKPWVLFSSMVSPHYPLIAPERFFGLYAGAELPRPRLYDEAYRPSHPVIAYYRKTRNYDDHFDEERLAVGIRAYYGLCSFLDFQIGRILAALAQLRRFGGRKSGKSISWRFFRHYAWSPVSLQIVFGDMIFSSTPSNP